ncbi:hypothetical protein ACHQM5_012496 [Ranunculus cassubicifolius]
MKIENQKMKKASQKTNKVSLKTESGSEEEESDSKESGSEDEESGSKNEENGSKDVTMQIPMGRLHYLVCGLWSDHNASQLDAVCQFKMLLAMEYPPPIDEVIATGVVQRFVEFLARDDFPRLQWEAIMVLTNIACGTSEHARVVIEHGAIPIFVKLINSPATASYVKELVVWSLGNVSDDSQQIRELALSHGAMTSLISLLDMHPTRTTLQTVAETLPKFCMTGNLEQTKLALAVLERLIHSTDEYILSRVCSALGYICDGTDEKTQAVIEAMVCQRLVELLLHPSPSVVAQALWAFTMFVSGDYETHTETRCIINQALPCLLNLITQTHYGSLKKEACETILNITAGYEEQIQAVITAGIIGPLVDLLQTAEYVIKKEAAIAILNATVNSSAQQIKYLVSQGCIRGLCDFLTSPDSDIVRQCLEGLENILKAGETEKIGDKNIYAELMDETKVLEKIENLQSHCNNNISEKALTMRGTYWPEYAGKDGLLYGDGVEIRQSFMTQRRPFKTDEYAAQVEIKRLKVMGLVIS